jgi:hypothetical protein
MNDFDTDSKTPIPTVIDPTTFVRNPGAKWVNGNRAGEGALLYGGYEVRLTESMMRSNPRTAKNPNGYFNLDSLLKTNDLFSLSGEAARLRREAQGMNDIYTFENSIVENYEYSVLRWFTHVPDPKTGISKKYIVEVANNRMLPVRVIELKRDWWPIVQRKFSPISHDFVGTSIPDTAGDTAMADINGMYLFHEDRFRKTQDFTFKFNKWLPVKGAGSLQDAAIPLRTREVSQTVQYILNYLDQSAKLATATPDVQAGAPASGGPQGDQTLGQTNLQVQGVSGRHSLTAKVFGWSEKEFWKHWYWLYDEYFGSELGEKMATLEGQFGTKWIPIRRKDIITGNTMGPKIKVESKSMSEAAKLRQYQMMQGFVQAMVQDPGIQPDKTYTYRKMARLLMPKQEAERMIPLSIDEWQALEENKKLNDGDMPKVTVEQNHQVHLRVHASADDTPATKRHIQIHIFMLMQKRQFPQAFPQLPGEQAPGTPMTPTNPQSNSANNISAPAQGVASPTGSGTMQ